MNTPPTSESAPRLWNPSAAAWWSLLFSPAFGSFLHARNADALGRPEEAKANRMWFYASLVYVGVALVCSFIPGIPDAVFRGASIGILVGWYVGQGKKQIAHVKETLPDDYPRKSWAAPLLIAFGCMFALIVMIIVFAIVMEIISPTQ